MSGQGRFDYVKYDEQAQKTQDMFKHSVIGLEKDIVGSLADSRAQSLALTKLEEVYMWIGKAIRDDQIKRNGLAPLQEDKLKTVQDAAREARIEAYECLQKSTHKRIEELEKLIGALQQANALMAEKLKHACERCECPFPNSHGICDRCGKRVGA